MSCMCLFGLIKRSDRPAATARFCVFSSTPSPALETYSSRVRSTTWGASTASRNWIALSHCAASSLPTSCTSPFGPSEISNMDRSNQRLGERDDAAPVGVLVQQGVGHAADQVQTEPA